MRSIGSIWKATLRAMAHPYRQSLSKVSTPLAARELDRERVLDISRPGPGRGKHHVEGDVVAGKVGVAGEPILRSPDDAPPRTARQRPAGLIEGLALLHLDEGEPLSFERHEIDLAYGRLVAPGDDAVAFEAKQERGDGFGKEPMTVCPDTLLAHGRLLPLRSSARPSS